MRLLVSPGSLTARRHPRVDAVLVGVLAILPFLPGVFGEFLNWDDAQNFLAVQEYRGLGLRNLAWMWTAFHMGHYTPLTWMTIGLDHTIWGMNPRGYHVTSFLFHAATACAFMLVARRLLRSGFGDRLSEPALRIGAVTAVLLFAVHPLRVESVVWLSERRDVVSGLLYMLTVLAYLRAAETGRRRWYWASVTLFVAAMLSKALVLSLPLVLVALDIFPLRRLGGARGWRGSEPRQVWLEKVPFFVLATAGAVLAFKARAPLHAELSLEQLDLTGRAIVSVYGYAFYLWKTVVPLGLSPLYEFPMLHPPLTTVMTSALAVVGLVATAVVTVRRWPGVTVGVWAYLVTLGPVIGIVQSGPQITADRYTYLACLGWAVLGGAGLARLAEQWLAGTRHRSIGAGALVIGALTLVTLTALSARQSLVWQDSTTLWAHARALDPTSARAHSGLAVARFEEGDRRGSRELLEQALRLSPRLVEAHRSLAVLLALEGDGEAALRHASTIVALRPHVADGYRFHAEILVHQNRFAEALAVYAEALRREPASAQTRYAMAMTLADLGRNAEALAMLAEAEKLAGPHSLDPERDRYRARVYAVADPERAKDAWRRYLRTMGALHGATSLQRYRMMEALEALEALERGGPRGASSAL